MPNTKDEKKFLKEDFFISDYIEEDFDPTELNAKQKENWKQVYSFAYELNRQGRMYTETDIINVCQMHLISKEKVEKAFKKVFDNNKDEFGIADKPEIFKVEVWLRKHWDFAENVITQVPEFKKKNENKYEVLNIDSIYRKLQHSGFKFGLDKLKSLLKSDFVEKYNPFLDYFDSLEAWDGKTDHIRELANYVSVQDQDFFVRQFKKCLVRCIGCSLYGKENRIVFVLVGEKQNTGKSTFIRFLSPFKTKYYTEAPMHNNKDSSFSMSENFIYNLEELASLSNIDVNRLKSIISTATIKERKAYARDAIEQPRRANFFASTNKTEFLTDTENTRWLCFNLDSIDWEYTKLDMSKVWAQAYYLYHDSNFNDQLTKEESDLRDSKNKTYEINDYEKELIKRHFRVCEPHEGEFFSNADILDVLQADGGKKLESRYIGKNMVQLGFIKHAKKLNGHTVRGYYAKKLIASYQEEPNLFTPKDDKPF